MKRMKALGTGLLCCILTLVFSCQHKPAEKNEGVADTENIRIVSLNGTITEIICSLGLESKIVGVDATTTYPVSAAEIQKVGYGKNIAAEKVLALNPTIVIGFKETVKPELAEQLRAANIKVLLYDQEFSIEASKALIYAVADTLHITGKKEELVKQIETDLAAKTELPNKPKVLFIYARGAGTLTVCGNKTAAQKVIELAGGQNAISGFEDYKPLTPEALVAANPDIVLMFTSGLESLGGLDGFLKIPGVAQTNAGKNKRVIEMDGQYLTGFGPRVGAAIAELSKKLGEN